jgi:hypothetical protein
VGGQDRLYQALGKGEDGPAMLCVCSVFSGVALESGENWDCGGSGFVVR